MKELSELILEIDEIYSQENLKESDYEKLIYNLQKILETRDYHILIDDKDLEFLEIIQIESYLKTEKYMNGFLNLGKFKKIDFFVSYSL